MLAGLGARVAATLAVLVLCLIGAKYLAMVRITARPPAAVACPRCEQQAVVVEPSSPPTDRDLLYGGGAADAARMAALTQWVQAEIRRHQARVATEEGCKDLILTNGWLSGFGSSEMHVMGSHLSYAIERGLVLEWGPQACANLADRDDADCPAAAEASRCLCFFRPLAGAGNVDGAGRCGSTGRPVATIQGSEQRWAVPKRFEAALRGAVPGLSDAQVMDWWRAQSVAYLLRPNGAAAGRPAVAHVFEGVVH